MFLLCSTGAALTDNNTLITTYISDLHRGRHVSCINQLPTLQFIADYFTNPFIYLKCKYLFRRNDSQVFGPMLI